MLHQNGWSLQSLQYTQSFSTSPPFVAFSAPPPDPLQSLAQWPVLPQFLHKTVPLEPGPLQCLPFTKGINVASCFWRHILHVIHAPRVCGPLFFETQQHLLYPRLDMGNSVRNLFIHGTV